MKQLILTCAYLHTRYCSAQGITCDSLLQIIFQGMKHQDTRQSVYIRTRHKPECAQHYNDIGRRDTKHSSFYHRHTYDAGLIHTTHGYQSHGLKTSIAAPGLCKWGCHLICRELPIRYQYEFSLITWSDVTLIAKRVLGLQTH
jgi:hypothetical protein